MIEGSTATPQVWNFCKDKFEPENRNLRFLHRNNNNLCIESLKIMISRTGSGFDVILISAEYYDDHPLSPVGVIAKVLDAKGFKVGIIEKPMSKEDFAKLGAPELFFGVTSGSIDSMLNNYTPLKKHRLED